jgi:hypothetical protein
MDVETTLERARAEADAEFVAAFSRDLTYEWCEVYEAGHVVPKPPSARTKRLTVAVGKRYIGIRL